MINPNYFGNFYGNANNAPAPSTGFVMVRNEQEARNYPVAYGNSVTFKDESAPYIYSKTMGFSQLDRPVFEKYKLVKEEVREPAAVSTDYRTELDKLWAEVNLLKENRYGYESIGKSVPAGSEEDFSDEV